MENILITGADGFIGTNLKFFLKYNTKYNLVLVNKQDSQFTLKRKILIADFIFHCAGENKKNFVNGNIKLTENIINLIEENKKKIPVVFISTIKVNEKSLYGKTKLSAENLIINYGKKNKTKVRILRVPNVFGKWSKPNYNSFLVTMCYNISRNKKIKFINQNKEINLIYIDNLLKILLNLIKDKSNKKIYKILPDKIIKLKNLNKIILEIWKNYQYGIIPNMSDQFIKNLYSTFLYYLPNKMRLKKIKKKIDIRGFFSEIYKNDDFGQISIFSINPGKTRGCHLHYTKNEKFLLISGKAIYKSIDIKSNEKYSIRLHENNPIEFISIPGHWHEIKNDGRKKAFFMLWSNEIFNKKKPDTYYLKN